MEYKQTEYRMAASRNYGSVLQKQETQKAVGNESVLEKIASSYTKLPTIVSNNYSLDKCNCGNCGCLEGNWLLILSPVGVAASVSAFGPASAL